MSVSGNFRVICIALGGIFSELPNAIISSPETICREEKSCQAWGV